LKSIAQSTIWHVKCSVRGCNDRKFGILEGAYSLLDSGFFDAKLRMNWRHYRWVGRSVAEGGRKKRQICISLGNCTSLPPIRVSDWVGRITRLDLLLQAIIISRRELVFISLLLRSFVCSFIFEVTSLISTVMG
jgi:hypothetical protein